MRSLSTKMLRCSGFLTCMLAFIALVFSSPQTNAQSVLDSIEETIAGRVNELERAERLLAHPDPNTRLAAMEALIGSQDQALIDKAKEVGLFSGDPRLRAAAVRSIFDAGGTFRAEFAIPTGDDNITQIYDWLRRANGSWSTDGSIGHFGFVLGDFDEAEDCWKWPNGRNCALHTSGEDVLTGNWNFNNMPAAAVMRLDESGALVGSFLVNGRGTAVTVRIPLYN